MKKTISFLMFLGIFIAVSVGFYILKGHNKNSLNNTFSNSTSSTQKLTEIVLFYGIGCPHCAKVEEFIKTNKIKEKIEFEEKEVYYNKENAQKLIEIAKNCGFKENEIGVPFLWDGENQKCIIGDEPIINFFKEKLNL
jgi:glutaredoxin